MHNPPHPVNWFVRNALFAWPDRTAAARALGVTRKALSELINGHSAFRPNGDSPVKAFGSEPETWLGMQMEYDLWHATRRASRFQGEKLYPGERKARDRSFQ